jgi:hypothetical protein
MAKSILIFDIDGTLAKKENFDVPLPEIDPKRDILGIALTAQKPKMGRMAIVTARPEAVRQDTEEWVRKHKLKPEFLLMRKEGDLRPDYEVRVDQVRELIKKMGGNVILYDDKLSNCKAVEKALGVTCIHVPN